jgi:hypothetical protein
MFQALMRAIGRPDLADDPTLRKDERVGVRWQSECSRYDASGRLSGAPGASAVRPRASWWIW